MIKSNGGVFGRNPTFQDVTVDGNLTVNGDLALGDDITINDTLLVNGVATFKGGIISTGTAAAPTSNTVMGSGAGAALQAGGTNNVLIGSSAGAAITTGDDVVAIGFDAAKLNTANDTVAIGSGALDANTTGASNTAVGRNALGANTQGVNNTAVGFQAGSLMTTGQDNAFFGTNAGQSCTSNGNVAVGNQALQFATSGGSNTMVGYVAGLSTNSNNTVAIGAVAFLPTSVTTDSVAVGWQSGRYVGTGTTNCTSLTNSVLLGSDARAGADSQTNQIVIGYQGRGNGSNTTTIGNSSTTGTFIPAGNLTLTNGNFIVGTSGKGIDFSATTNSSGTMTSELLDDYEEGNWTPVLRGATTAGTYEQSGSSAKYTKIGSLCTLHLTLNTAAVVTGGGTGDILIQGLPFQVDSFGVFNVVSATGITFSKPQASFYANVATSELRILAIDNATGTQSIEAITVVGASDSIRGTITYLTAT